jgi:hypothetical protein
VPHFGVSPAVAPPHFAPPSLSPPRFAPTAPLR